METLGIWSGDSLGWQICVAIVTSFYITIISVSLKRKKKRVRFIFTVCNYKPWKKRCCAEWQCPHLWTFFQPVRGRRAAIPPTCGRVNTMTMICVCISGFVSQWLIMLASHHLHLSLFCLCMSGCICVCVCVCICKHIWICRMYIVAWEIECASLLNRTHVFERRFSYKQRQVSSTAKCAGNLSLMHYFHFKQVVGPALFLESTVMDLPGRRRSTCNSRSFIYITQGEGLLPWRTTYTHIA